MLWVLGELVSFVYPLELAWRNVGLIALHNKVYMYMYTVSQKVDPKFSHSFVKC